MTRLPKADALIPERARYHESGTSEPQPLRGKRTSLLLRCFSSLTHSPFAAQRTRTIHISLNPTTPDTNILRHIDAAFTGR